MQKKKKKKKSSLTTPSKAPHAVFLKGFTDNYVSQGQTEPPTIPIFQLYKDKPFPVGEIQEYIQPFNSHRMTDEEVRGKEATSEASR